MPQNKNGGSVSTDCLEVLDELIKRYYRRLLEKIDTNLKPGDLIKMIELRNKLAPTNTEQEKFWAMLSKIRRDTIKSDSSKRKVRKSRTPGGRQSKK